MFSRSVTIETEVMCKLCTDCSREMLRLAQVLVVSWYARVYTRPKMPEGLEEQNVKSLSLGSEIMQNAELYQHCH